MDNATATTPPGTVEKREPLIASSVLGMLIFIFTELMLFMGMISAFLVVKANAVGGVWPPPGQPRLPAGETAFNTALLLASGVCLFFAHRAWKAESENLKRLLAATVILGALFVGLQGVEWVALLGEGLTMSSSNHGSFFYLLVGTHALHAVGALVMLGYVLVAAFRDDFDKELFWASETFWYFVVGMWPLLYWLIYL